MGIINMVSQRALLAVFLFATAVTLNADRLWLAATHAKTVDVVSTKTFERTDLFFGSSMPDGRTVSEAEWCSFLDSVITPCFPDGLTVLPGSGQFKNAVGRVVKENANVVVLLYPSIESKQSRQKIEEIRNAYKSRFHQESVLKVEYPSPVRVSF